MQNKELMEMMTSPTPVEHPGPLGSPCPPPVPILSGDASLLARLLQKESCWSWSPASSRPLSALPAEVHFSNASSYSRSRVQVAWV